MMSRCADGIFEFLDTGHPPIIPYPQIRSSKTNLSRLGSHPLLPGAEPFM